MPTNDTVVKLRVPTSVAEHWKSSAKHSGISLSAWIRLVCDKASASDTPLVVPRMEPQEVPGIQKASEIPVGQSLMVRWMCTCGQRNFTETCTWCCKTQR